MDQTIRRISLGLLLLSSAELSAQTVLDEAYAALRARQFQRAAELFQQGLRDRPEHPTARKDLAYTWLRLGENELARDQFRAAYALRPEDEDAALEFAFLAHDTGQRGESRRVFDRLRQSRNPRVRTTAETAFFNIDQALAEGIARWQSAAEQRPQADSVHEELAQLAEQRGLLALAEKHYRIAFQLKPAKRHFLLDLGRVRSQLGLREESWAAYWAAYRSADIRTSERAREFLPSPVPPRVFALARDLEPPRQLRSGEERSGISAVAMAEKSFELGYLPDAERYFRAAYETDPGDRRIQLRLGQLANLRHEDREAYRWFAAAKRAADPEVAREAREMWRNLRETEAPFRPTIWIQPVFSTRWHSAFAYGQAKLTLRPRWRGWRAYASIRFAGDTGARQAPAPLSERAMTPAVGVESPAGRWGTLWFEAGANAGSTQGGDLRGGWLHQIARGAQLGTESGWFSRTEGSANYASRFGQNVLLGLRPRWGYVWGPVEVAVVAGVSRDLRGQYWGNFLEAGPSVRWRLPRPLLAGVTFQAEWVRGYHYAGQGNPGRPGYHDARVGLWYAITH